MKTIFKILMLATLAVCAQGAAFAQGLNASMQEVIIDEATSHIENNLPAYAHLVNNTVRIDDGGDEWVVVFESNVRGGVESGASPEIRISKTTLKAVGAK